MNMQMNLNQPLSSEEMEMLDEFLLYRTADDAYDAGKDEGVFNLSMLDGFLTAVVSGPEMAPPSQWLPSLWGDDEQIWDSEDQFRRIMSLLMRHMNGIAGALLEAPDDFEPIFLSREVEGKEYLIVDGWCEGYLRGVSLSSAKWNKGGKEIRSLLEPIALFGSEALDEELAKLPVEQIEALQQAVTPAVREIYRFWMARREKPGGIVMDESDAKVAAKVGRNEPCPCGSGKKFKRCCGSPVRRVH